MSLPTRVIGSFRLIPQQASDRDFHGPWNKLLNYLFAPDSPYTVIPREHYYTAATQEQSGVVREHQPELWFMKFEVQFENLPILILLVSAPTVIESPLARELADAEIRKRMTSSIELCPLPTLRGISVFGRYMSMYSCDVAAPKPEIYPTLIEQPVEEGRSKDVAPRDRWSSDIQSVEGQNVLTQLVDNIKAECMAEAKN